jgi:dephospho-CoA kinase
MASRGPGLLRVALTGGIATGKTHVRARLAARGVPTIDADAIVHELLGGGTAVAAAVLERFGAAVIRPDGSVDRPALGRLVFADARARAALEAIVHPAVYARIGEWIGRLSDSGAAMAVADIPLLFETGHERDFDAVVVAACDPARQVARVMARDGLSEAAARARLDAQWPIGLKADRADYVITTDGSFEDTDRQVDEVLSRLEARR